MPGAETAERQLSQNELGKHAQNLMAAVGDYCANSVLSEPPEGVSYSEHDFNSIIARIKRLQGQYSTQREGGLSVQQAGAIMRNEIRQADALQKLRVVGENSEEESRLQNQLRGLQEGHRQLLANFGFRELPEPAHPGPAANSGGHVHPEQASASPQEVPEPPTTRLSEPGDRTKRLLKALHRLQEDPDYVAPGEGDGFNPVELGRVRAMLADYPTEQGAKIIEAEICLEDIEDRLASVEGPNGDPQAAERLNREKTYWEAEKQRRLTLPSQRIDENDQDMQSTGAIPANEPTHRLTGAEMDRLIEENYHVLGERGKIQLAALHRLQEQPQLLGPSEDDEFTATQLKAVRNRLSAAAANYSELSADQQVAVVEVDIYLDDINIKLQDTHLNAEDREILERHRAHWLAEKQRRVDTQHAETQEGDAVWDQPTVRFDMNAQGSSAAGSSIPDTPTEHLSPDQLPGGHNAITVRDLSAADHVSEEQQAEPGFDPEVFEMLTPIQQQRLILKTLQLVQDSYSEALLIASLPEHYRNEILLGSVAVLPMDVRNSLSTMWNFDDGYADSSLLVDKITALAHMAVQTGPIQAQMMVYVLEGNLDTIVDEAISRLRGRLLVSQYRLSEKTSTQTNQVDAPLSTLDYEKSRLPQVEFESRAYEYEQLHNAIEVLHRRGYLQGENGFSDRDAIIAQGERFIEQSRRLQEEGGASPRPESVVSILNAVSQAVADGLYSDLDLATEDMQVLASGSLSADTRVHLFELFPSEKLTEELTRLGITPEVLANYYPLAEGEAAEEIQTVDSLTEQFVDKVSEFSFPREVIEELGNFISSELTAFPDTRESLLQAIQDRLVEYQTIGDSDHGLSPISATQRVQLEALVYGYLRMFDQRGFYDGKRIEETLGRYDNRGTLQWQLQLITHKNEGNVLTDAQWTTLFNAIEQSYTAEPVRIKRDIEDIVSFVYNELEGTDFGDQQITDFIEHYYYLLEAYLTRRTAIRSSEELDGGFLM